MIAPRRALGAALRHGEKYFGQVVFGGLSEILATVSFLARLFLRQSAMRLTYRVSPICRPATGTPDLRPWRSRGLEKNFHENQELFASNLASPFVRMFSRDHARQM
jgi:hypothetical protein